MSEVETVRAALHVLDDAVLRVGAAPLRVRRDPRSREPQVIDSMGAPLAHTHCGCSWGMSADEARMIALVASAQRKLREAIWRADGEPIWLAGTDVPHMAADEIELARAVLAANEAVGATRGDDLPRHADAAE